MDPSVLLMLSSLLHLHSHLDAVLPTSSTIASSSSSGIPLFFTIFSILSYAATSTLPVPSSPSPSSPLSSFLSLSTLPPDVCTSYFRSNFGLSYRLFSSLVRRLAPHLPPLPFPLPPNYAISLALSRLSQSISSRSLSRSHSLPPSLISKITNCVTRVLATDLYSLYVKPPSSRRLLDTIHSFNLLTSLPNVCGAIDTSPVLLAKSPSDHDDRPNSAYAAYVCKYGYPAVLLQVVADHRRVFWDVCVKAPGSVDDATHLRDSQLYERLKGGELFHDAVVTVKGHHVWPYLIGDWAFPLMSFMMTPFTTDGTGTPSQNWFDAAVMRGREASVVAAIELLKGRWKILREMDVGIDHVAQTVVACCVLHNMCQIEGEPEDEEEGVFGWQDPRESAPPARALDSEKSFHRCGQSLRQVLADDLHEKHLKRAR